MSPTESILEDYIAPKIIADIKQAQIEKGLKATGYSADSLTYEITRSGQFVTLRLWGASYWYYQQYGRGPNKRQGKPWPAFVQKIRDWITAKQLSIPLRAAYPIAWKIIREGVSVPNRYNEGDVLTVPLSAERIKVILLPRLIPEYVTYIATLLKGDSENG